MGQYEVEAVAKVQASRNRMAAARKVILDRIHAEAKASRISRRQQIAIVDGKAKKVEETVSPTPEALAKGDFVPLPLTRKGQHVGATVCRRSGIDELVSSGTIEESDREALERIAAAQRLIVQGIGHKIAKYERSAPTSGDKDWSKGQTTLVLTYIAWDKECRRMSIDPAVTVAVAVFDVSLRECVKQGLVASRRASRTSLLDGLAMYRKVAGERRKHFACVPEPRAA